MASMASIAGLRWILLGAGLLFLLGLAVWETLHSRSADRRAHADVRSASTRDVPTEPVVNTFEPDETVAEAPLRSGSPARGLHVEPTLGDLPAHLTRSDSTASAPKPSAPAPLAATPGPLATAPEPLATASEPHAALGPLSATAASPQGAESVSAAPAALAAAPAHITVPVAGEDGAVLVDWPPDGQRQIISVRIIGGDERLSGRAVRQALAGCGFVHGRYRIFHLPASDARALLSCASLSKPGNFDPISMDFQRFSGLSLFAVLPGPLPPVEAIETLLRTAQNLADRLQAELQDDQGRRLDEAGVAELRRYASGLAVSTADPVPAASAEPTT